MIKVKHIFKQNKHKEALEKYAKSLEIKRKIFGTDEDLSIADTLIQIARINECQGRYEEALENSTNSLEIIRKIFGTDEHSSMADALHQIACIYNVQSDYTNAIFYFEKTLTIKRKLMDQNNPLFLLSSDMITIIYRKLYYQSNHKHFFAAYYTKKNINEICSGIYLFGNCKSNNNELNSNIIYYKCQHCQDIDLILCKSCLDKFENEKYFSVNAYMRLQLCLFDMSKHVYLLCLKRNVHI